MSPRLYTEGNSGGGRDQPWCRHNAPEDQEDPHDDRRIMAGIHIVQHAAGGLVLCIFRNSGRGSIQF